MSWNSTVPEPYCEKQGVDIPCPRCGYVWTIREGGIAAVVVLGDLYSCPKKSRQLDATHRLFGTVRYCGREDG